MSKDTESLRKESEISINKSYTILEEQILSLRTLVANLRNAYNGLDVVWPEYGNLIYICYYDFYIINSNCYLVTKYL